MQVLSVKVDLAQEGEDLANFVANAIFHNGLQVEDGDIIVLASKIVSTAEGRIIELAKVKPSTKAKRLAKQFQLDPSFAELILKESDKIYGGVSKALLTLKNNILIANAGIDRKNAPRGSAILWPRDPRDAARKLRRALQARFGRRLGMMIIDSRLAPLRYGTMGVTLAASGFQPVRDYRGKIDLYGKKIMITLHSLADDLASAAHLVMGEGAEQAPICLIKGAPIELTDEDVDELVIPEEECMYMRALTGRRQKSTRFKST